MNRRATAGTAVAIAARAWGEAALSTRAELRAHGVKGDLRMLDEIASGRRGVAVSKGVTMVAQELRDAGVPEVQTIALLQQTVSTMTHGVYAMRDETRHGGHAA